MQVNYIVKGSGTSWGSAPLLFNNSNGDANEKFAPRFDDVAESYPGYGAASTIKVPLSNTKATLPFKWNSAYSSLANAMASVLTLRTTFKGVIVHLQVSEGATVHYYPNAILQTQTSDVHGSTVDHALQFISDDVTTTVPS